MRLIPYRYTLIAITGIIIVMMGNTWVSPVQSAPERPTLTFSVMSDLHIYERNVADHERLLCALRDYRRLDPNMDLMVMNGDLTNGFPSQYRTLQKLLAQVPHPPLHFTPGNHDFSRMLFNRDGQRDKSHFPNGWSSHKAIQLFKTFTGYDRPYHDTWVKGYHFIFLANERFWDYDRSIGFDGYLTEQQLNWLREKLEEKRGDEAKPVFVFFHQPLPDTYAGTDRARNIVQHEALREILEAHPEVLFFAGHTHYGLRKTKQWAHDTFLMLGSSSIKRHEESLYLEVYDGHIDIHSRDHREGAWIPERSYRYHTKKRSGIDPLSGRLDTTLVLDPVESGKNAALGQ